MARFLTCVCHPKTTESLLICLSDIYVAFAISLPLFWTLLQIPPHLILTTLEEVTISNSILQTRAPRAREGPCVPRSVPRQWLLSPCSQPWVVAPCLRGVPAQSGGEQEMFGCLATKWSTLQSGFKSGANPKLRASSQFSMLLGLPSWPATQAETSPCHLCTVPSLTCTLPGPQLLGKPAEDQRTQSTV